MAYFSDLSNYVYLTEAVRPNTQNVGWLEQGHSFDRSEPSDDDLSILWEFCKVSVAQTRGIHSCDLCGSDEPVVCERAGVRLLLGTSEIRVFSPDGVIYAAPTLVYHYMLVHHYRPPTLFLHALRNGAKPPSDAYFEGLKSLNLEWNKTSGSEAAGPLFRLDQLPK